MLERLVILAASVQEDAVRDLINAIPSSLPLMSADDKPSKGRRGFYRRIINDEGLIFDVFGEACDIQTAFALEIAVEGSDGLLLLIDSRNADALERTRSVWSLIRSFPLEAFVVADLNPASQFEHVREALELTEADPLIICNVSDPISVKQVLLSLLQRVPTFKANAILLSHLS